MASTVKCCIATLAPRPSRPWRQRSRPEGRWAVASSVVAILFPNTTDAGRLKTKLEGLQGRELLKLLETTVIVRDQNGKVKYDTGTPRTGTGAAWGSLIG